MKELPDYYKLRDDRGCSSCGIEHMKMMEAKSVFLGNSRDILLCHLCASTAIGSSEKYPAQYTFATPRMIAQATWWLLEQINQTK